MFGLMHPWGSAPGVFYCYLLKVAALFAGDTDIGEGFGLFLSVTTLVLIAVICSFFSYLPPLLPLSDEIANLFLSLESYYKAKAKERQLSTLKQNATDVQNSAPREETGKVRDKLAEKA